MATWGPIQLRLKGSRQVEFDGEASPAPGGGSTPRTVIAKVNGLVKDFAPEGGIDGIGALLFDPTPQPWQADHEYSNNGTGASQYFIGAYVTKTDDPTVAFIAGENGSAVTGGVEPEWSEDGITTVLDGTADRPLLWSPSGLYAEWAAATAIPGGAIVLGNGGAWQSDGGGNTGGSEPDWPADPNNLDTLPDNEVTWQYLGPCAVWTAATRYSFKPDTPSPTADYSQFFAIPTGATPGVSYVFQGQPTGVFGTSGATEPDWGDAVAGDGGDWFDGDIMWTEATTAAQNPMLVVTGIEAPADPVVVTIGNALPPSTSGTVLLEDQAQAEGDYGPAAPSAPGNGFDESWTLTATQGNQVRYTNDAWTVIQTGTA